MKTEQGFQQPVEVRVSKTGVIVNYHFTWAGAYVYLKAEASIDLHIKQRQLELANAHYGKVKRLRKPVETELAQSNV